MLRGMLHMRSGQLRQWLLHLQVLQLPDSFPAAAATRLGASTRVALELLAVNATMLLMLLQLGSCPPGGQLN